MGWIDRILRKRRVYSGNTPVVSEQQAAETPDPDHARIVVPDNVANEEFVDNLTAHEDGRSCGHCIHFNLKAGQARIHDHEAMILPRILEQFELNSVKDHVNPGQIGLCEQWSSSHQESALRHATSPPTVAAWWVDTSIAYHLRDTQKPCRYFKLKPKGWKKLLSGVI